MRKILIPIDASDCAKRAAEYAAKMASENPELQLHLLNVQDALEPRVHAAMSAQEIKNMQATDSQRVMQPVMQMLDHAGIPYRTDWRAGDAAQTIASYADEIGCESIVMGTRGMGPVSSLVMGSVAMKVAHLAKAPITLVK